VGSLVVRIWNALLVSSSRWKILRVYEEEYHGVADRAVYGMVVSPDGRYFALATSESIVVWNLNADYEICCPTPDADVNGLATHIAFSADGQLLTFWEACEYHTN